jgi:hypothetical protein
MSSEQWDGVERRDCNSCRAIGTLDERITTCKNILDAEIDQIHTSISDLKGEVHGLRSDVHKMTDSVSSINISLETIAQTLTKLTDFPETWNKIQGFWSVMKWLKDNILLLAVVIGVFLYIVDTFMVH